MKIKKSRKYLSNSIIGVFLFFALIVLLNLIVRHVNFRIDATQDKIFTLSKGTKRIIDSLEVPVKIRYYVTEKNNTLPPNLRNYSARVEDMLNELSNVSKGKIKVVKFDPEPDSDAEELAELDGLVAQSFERDESVYFGMSFTCIDNQDAIPFLIPEREAALEYEIIKRIAEVAAFEKPKIGLITALPLKGGKAENAAPGGGIATFEKWIILEELEKKYDIVDLDLNVEDIPEELDALLVIHPVGMMEIGERALDNFVRRGGKLLLLLDPASMTPELLQYKGEMSRSSNAPNLLSAWGIKYRPDQMITDWQFGTNLGSNEGEVETLTVLSINADGLNNQSQIIGSLDYLAFPFTGAMKVKNIEGVKSTILVSSSKQSSTIAVKGFQPMDASQNYITRNNFRSAGKSQVIALQLEGVFPSAFPSLQIGNGHESEVVIILDTDFLYDFFAVRKRSNLGETEIIPVNGNISFFMNALAAITDKDNLGDVRSRELIRRPFLRIQKMESVAREQFKIRISEVEGELRDTESQLESLQKEAMGIADGSQIPPSVKHEITRLKSRRRDLIKQLKVIRLQLRRDINQLENRIKWVNIGLMPLLVILFGFGNAFYRKRKFTNR